MKIAKKKKEKKVQQEDNSSHNIEGKQFWIKLFEIDFSARRWKKKFENYFQFGQYDTKNKNAYTNKFINNHQSKKNMINHHQVMINMQINT